MYLFKRQVRIYIFFQVVLYLFLSGGAIAQEVDKNNKFKSPEEIEAFFTKTRGVEKKTELMDLVLPLEVNFELNSARLTGSAKKQLDNLAAVLLKPRNIALKLELAGHTCDLGGEQYNLDLSQKRITSAYDYLKNKYNIGKSRLSTLAYGESLPVIPNATSEKERTVNRRVVVYLPENRAIIEQILKKNLEDPGFQWAVFHYTKDNKTRLVNYNGSTALRSDDQYRVYIRPDKKKYVYIFQMDTHGNGDWLFPRDDSYFKNPVDPGEYYLPHRSRVFVLDDNLGMEKISILATDAAVIELENMILGHSSATYAEVVTQVVKTRGLKVTRIAPPPSGLNTQQGTIAISGDGSQSDDTPASMEREIQDIMTEYGEFYAEIEFEHKN